jgi:hypothetical protein
MIISHAAISFPGAGARQPSKHRALGAMPLTKAVYRRCREPEPHPFARYRCGLVHDNGNFTAYRLRNYHDHENVIVIMALPAGTVKHTAIDNPTLPLN